MEGLKVTSGNQGPNSSPGRKRAGEAITSLWGKTGPVGDRVQGPQDHIRWATASGARGHSMGLRIHGRSLRVGGITQNCSEEGTIMGDTERGVGILLFLRFIFCPLRPKDQRLRLNPGCTIDQPEGVGQET